MTVALPTFFSRVADSLRPVADVDPAVLAEKLHGVRLSLDMSTTDASAPDAYLLACNLAARLYPVIDLRPGPGSTRDDALTVRARDLILAINPDADLLLPDSPITSDPGTESYAAELHVRLVLGALQPPDSEPTGSDAGPGARVNVAAHGWAVAVDPSPAWYPSPSGDTAGHPLAWLAAAALGMSEVFRVVFADELGERGRRGAQPGGFNLLTAEPVDAAVPSPPAGGTETIGRVVLDELFLVGAGAIGQAAVLALSHLDVEGSLHIVDPEEVTPSNLQRYVLTRSDDVGAVKVDLVERAVARGSSGERPPVADFQVHGFRGRWGDLEEHLEADQVLVGLDTAQDRIIVAATRPRHAYNAWTQVADLGWSRHERLGVDPCLACLYYPTRARKSDHELIAEALDQPPLRILAYLTYNLPIGYPVLGVPALVDLPAPPDAFRWTQVALIDDLLTTGMIGETERSRWADMTVGALYRDGICAGGLLPVGDLPGEALVPLAHQSALAGIMLAAEIYISRSDELSSQRDQWIEHRYDVLRGFPQVVGRPRERTPHCLCDDHLFLANGSPAESVEVL